MAYSAIVHNAQEHETRYIVAAIYTQWLTLAPGGRQGEYQVAIHNIMAM